jgi:DNA polymerase-3 subunit epsilon
MELLEQPVATAEFLVVDTETNGLGGDACELTEVGTVLVGGGELHERWASLVRTSVPLRRGIQRFTGITQAMVQDAPSLEDVLPPLAERMGDRVLVAHNAPFDRRVLRQGFERIGIEWPDPPVLCTAALARAVLPLQRERRLTALADALGIEVELAHRALPDAETCARILCALFPRLCANAGTVADAVALLRPRRRRVTRRATPGPRGVPVSGRAWGDSLRRQIGLDPESRPGPFRPLDRAGQLDCPRGDRRLPRDPVRARRARAGEPVDQAAAPARQRPPHAPR